MTYSPEGEGQSGDVLSRRCLSGLEQLPPPHTGGAGRRRSERAKRGRPRKVDDADGVQARDLREKGITANDIAKMMGVSRATRWFQLDYGWRWTAWCATPLPTALRPGSRWPGHRLDHTITIAVDDNERGLPAEEDENVLGRFARGSSAAAGGSGLGLALVVQQAALHGGNIVLSDSPLGLRATLTFLALSTEPLQDSTDQS